MIVEPHIPLRKLIHMNRDCRNEISHGSFNRMNRDAPYAEESQNMINSECIKIITHLHEALMPPFKSVFRHLFPIISRESPVLSLHRKIIGRSACLVIQMK